MMAFKNGDRVQWQEGGAGQFLFTGTIINEEKYPNGSNPYGHWNIRVDDEHRLRACHTARECSSGWVVRSEVFNLLRPIE
jgi:hypothetical protein